MVKKFLETNKKKVIVITISAILIISLIGFLQTKNIVEAAVLDPNPGFVAWWSFDEETGITAIDSSENGNNGTLYGGTVRVQGKYNQSIEFDGVDGHILIPDSNKIRDYINLQNEYDSLKIKEKELMDQPEYKQAMDTTEFEEKAVFGACLAMVSFLPLGWGLNMENKKRRKNEQRK